MLAHVGQRLLDDPIGRAVDLRRQRPPLPYRRGPHRQARVRGQLVETFQAERGLPRRRLFLRPQHAEDRADLAQRLGARGLDRGERLPRLLRAVVHEVQADAGLDIDQRQVVPEHVVQLAGDAQPFLGRLPAFLLLAGPGPLGADLHHLRHVLRADLGGTAEHDRQSQARGGQQGDAQVRPGTVRHAELPGKGPGDQEVRHVRGRGGHDGGASPAGADRAEQRDQGRDRERPTRRGECGERDRRRRGHGEYGDRVPPAPEQSDRPDQQDRDREEIHRPEDLALGRRRAGPEQMEQHGGQHRTARPPRVRAVPRWSSGVCAPAAGPGCPRRPGEGRRGRAGAVLGPRPPRWPSPGRVFHEPNLRHPGRSGHRRADAVPRTSRGVRRAGSLLPAEYAAGPACSGRRRADAPPGRRGAAPNRRLWRQSRP
jgi:hypothetical protein